MKILISTFFVLTLFFSAVAGEKGRHADGDADKPLTVNISGTVTDAKTGETLVGVQVQLDGTNKKVYTDFDGNFTFDDILPGKYDITASYISYEKQKIEKQDIDIFSSRIKVQLKPTN